MFITDVDRVNKSIIEEEPASTKTVVVETPGVYTKLGG